MRKLKVMGMISAVAMAMIMAVSLTGCGDDASSVSRAANTTTKSISEDKDAVSESNNNEKEDEGSEEETQDAKSDTENNNDNENGTQQDDNNGEMANINEAAERIAAFNVCSQKKLKEYLEEDGYSSDEAETAASQCTSDWFHNAILTAETVYQAALNTEGISLTKNDVCDRLVYVELFEPDQASYGVENADIDWQ